MYEYLHLWFLWKTWNHWEYPEKNVLLYTIDQDIFHFILNLRFIFVTYVFVPYFVIFMECFVECYRQKLIFKINWKIGTPIPIVNKQKIQFRIRLLTRMNFFLWFSSSMSSISSRSMSTLFGNSVWKINEIIKKCSAVHTRPRNWKTKVQNFSSSTLNPVLSVILWQSTAL